MRHSKLKILLTTVFAFGITANATASNFGTSKTYSQMYPPSSFHPETETNEFHASDQEHHCDNGVNYYAPVHLPTGAKPVGLTAIMRDNQASNINVKLQRVCNGFNFFTTPNTTLTTTTIVNLNSSGNSTTRKYFSQSATGTHHVNNLQCAYQIKIDYNACSTSNEVNRVALRYKRDVTPAPSGAPYSDVPASHPFAQHINAFKNAGITGGCSGGNYCPDDPVTRGQMAVFLSKALGLSWSDSNGISIILPGPALP